MDNLDREILELESQLKETLAAEQFLEHASGRLITSLFAKKITKLTREITSDKYRKDFAGYNNALSELRAYQTILKELQVAGSPVRARKIREKLEEAEESRKIQKNA